MKMKSVRLAAVIMILSGIAAGCGSSDKNNTAGVNYSYDSAAPAAGEYGYVSSNTTASAAMDFEAAYPEESYTDGQTSSQELVEENSNASNRKLIKTVDMSVETENYDELLVNLASQIKQLGGYIEYQYEYNGRSISEYNSNRNANWEIRIPTAHFDEFVVQVDEETNIIDKTERVTDVTLKYVDLESHKTALLTEQKRLLELVENADTIEDIITIEQRLSDVRYELESMESQLRMLDNQIDYSTINLSIQEVKRIVIVEENSVWDRIRNGFSKTLYNLGDGLVNLFVWFIVNIPYFIVWAVVIAAVIFVIRKIRKHRAAKKEKRQQQLTDNVNEESKE